MLKIRRSHDRLIFNMGIPIPGKDSLYIETGPQPFSIPEIQMELIHGIQHRFRLSRIQMCYPLNINPRWSCPSDVPLSHTHSVQTPHLIIHVKNWHLPVPSTIKKITIFIVCHCNQMMSSDSPCKLPNGKWHMFTMCLQVIFRHQ